MAESKIPKSLASDVNELNTKVTITPTLNTSVVDQNYSSMQRVGKLVVLACNFHAVAGTYTSGTVLMSGLPSASNVRAIVFDSNAVPIAVQVNANGEMTLNGTYTLVDRWIWGEVVYFVR